jgi:hypothetical protein
MSYRFAVCTVKTSDDGQRNCPKYVDFHSKNKFEKLVHLVGFVKRTFLKFILGMKFYMFRTVPLSIIRGFSLYTAMVYVIQVCGQLTSRIRMEFHYDPACELLANLYGIYHCCVYSEKLLTNDRETV